MTAPSTTQTDRIHYLDATTLAALIRTRQLSSREVVQAHLDRIATVNPKINAVVTLMADDALKSADAADKIVASGAVLGPPARRPVLHQGFIGYGRRPDQARLQAVSPGIFLIRTPPPWSVSRPLVAFPW